jgi:phage terminase small subunit
MPPLINPRHERFSQALFEGKSANRAYEEAGYRPHDGNAIRLRGNERVKARLAELQEAAAANIQVTGESLIRELEEVRKRATSDAQWGSVVKSIEAKGKLSDLFETKIRVTRETAEPPPDASVEDIARWTAEHWDLEGAILTPTQRVEFAALLHRVLAEIGDFLRPFRAANAKQISPPTRSPAEYEQRRLEIERRRSNGR